MRFVAEDEHGLVVGHFELEKFPGSNQIAISSHAFIEEEHRGKGYGKAAAEDRVMLARRLGFDYLLCTVVSTNAVQRHILEQLGWSCLDEFDNRVTDNTVCLYGRRVEKT